MPQAKQASIAARAPSQCNMHGHFERLPYTPQQFWLNCEAGFGPAPESQMLVNYFRTEKQQTRSRLGQHGITAFGDHFDKLHDQ